MNEIEELEYIDYLQYRRGGFIHFCNHSGEGGGELGNAKKPMEPGAGKKGTREIFGKPRQKGKGPEKEQRRDKRKE